MRLRLRSSGRLGKEERRGEACSDQGLSVAGGEVKESDRRRAVMGQWDENGEATTAR